MIEAVYAFLVFCWVLIVIRCLVPKKKRLYKRYIKTTKEKNTQNKSTQNQQKTYQTTYYDNFNQETHKPLQQKIVKDFYKDYANFDPIKSSVKNTIYDNLLHSDSWKTKRDKILKRDNHTCRYCGKTTGSLQVHHKYYNVYPNGTKPDPWDYPDEALITLCDNCHKRVHQTTKIKTYYRKKYLHYSN